LEEDSRGKFIVLSIALFMNAWVLITFK